jgi:hypothetical protein
MLVKAYAPSALLLVVAILSDLIIGQLDAHPILAGVKQIVGWLPAAAFAGSMIHWGTTTFRLSQWQEDTSPGCMVCGGLLGRERDGRWGAYRKCLACGKNNSQKHYGHG